MADGLFRVDLAPAAKRQLGTLSLDLQRRIGHAIDALEADHSVLRDPLGG